MTGADRNVDIHCPSCRWRPGPDARWSCMPSCGTAWNTFWTRGVCPGCGWKWVKTQCLSCGEVSPHEAWYHYPPEARDEDERVIENHEAA